MDNDTVALGWLVFAVGAGIASLLGLCGSKSAARAFGFACALVLCSAIAVTYYRDLNPPRRDYVEDYAERELREERLLEKTRPKAKAQ